MLQSLEVLKCSCMLILFNVTIFYVNMTVVKYLYCGTRTWYFVIICSNIQQKGINFKQKTEYYTRQWKPKSDEMINLMTSPISFVSIFQCLRVLSNIKSINKIFPLFSTFSSYLDNVQYRKHTWLRSEWRQVMPKWAQWEPCFMQDSTLTFKTTRKQNNFWI